MLVDNIKVLRCERCGQIVFSPSPGIRTRPGQITQILAEHKKECKGRPNETASGSSV
jgi:hypothetical protein